MKIKKILISPQEFKESLTGLEVANAIQEGINKGELREIEAKTLWISEPPQSCVFLSSGGVLPRWIYTR